MIFIAFFFLAYTASASCMMNFSTTDLLCLQSMYKPRAALQDYLLNDHIAIILRHLPFNDQLSLTSTCKQFNALSVHAQYLKPQLTNEIFSRQVFGFLPIFLGGFGAVLGILPYVTQELIHKDDIVLQIAVPVLTICTTGVVMASSIICCAKKVEKEDVDTRIKRTRIMYDVIAQRMHDNRLSVESLSIDYFTPLQIASILKAAREGKVINITVQKHSCTMSVNFPYSSLLTNNSQLKSLKIKNANKPFIDNNNLYIVLVQNSCLEELELSGMILSSHVLFLIMHKKNINKFSLINSNPNAAYDLSELPNNTTLKNLKLSCVKITDNAVPYILSFMKNNRNVESLTIEWTQLSNAAMNQLKASQYKPAHCEIKGWI